MTLGKAQRDLPGRLFSGCSFKAPGTWERGSWGGGGGCGGCGEPAGVQMEGREGQALEAPGQASEECGCGSSPGRQLCGRASNPTVSLLLHLILNNHKLLLFLLINMCCLKMRKVYTASLSHALCSLGFFSFHLS